MIRATPSTGDNEALLEWARRELELRADESTLPINEAKRARAFRRRDAGVTRAQSREYLDLAAREWAA